MPSFEQFIPVILKSLRSTFGEEFFNSIVIQLNSIIKADYTFIARIDKENYTSKTIALVAKNQIADNFEYDLAGTPCSDVSDDSICIYAKKICSIYPEDQLLIDMKIEGYIGTPLHDSNGEVMGLIVALYENEIKDPDFVATLFDFFSGRIGAELERYDREQDLEQLNNTLEQRVLERTSELTDALSQLKSSQERLIEQEKMASLGTLVAGVAHEINTPLGVAILSGSNIEEIIRNIEQKLTNQSLSKSELEHSIKQMHELIESLGYNLDRAAQLVQDFKQVAIERTIDDINKIEIYSWFQALLTSLNPLLKKTHIQFDFDMTNKKSVISTSPAKLSQVFVNLITNAITHAFPKNTLITNKKISLHINEKGSHFIFTLADNGVGVPKDVQGKIFDPFFTTNRFEGNSGLGLSIVSNIISGNLKGKISLNKKISKGCEFIVTLPKEIPAN